MNSDIENLLEEHRSMMLSYASALLRGDEHEAQDVVQEACLTAYSKKGEYNAELSFSKWVRGIIRFKVLESRRYHAKLPRTYAPEMIAGVDRVYELFDTGTSTDIWEDRLEVLRLCVKKLKSPMQSVVDKFYRSELSMKDISVQLDISVMTVGQRLSRARKLIRLCVAKKRKI